QKCGEKFRTAWTCSCEYGHAGDSRNEDCSQPGARLCVSCDAGYALNTESGKCERDPNTGPLPLHTLNEDVELDEDEARVTSVDEQDVTKLEMTEILIMIGVCTGISLLASCAHLGAQ
ncbi:unnamed protein product, partial [Amoebophrya sp. A25]